jgi:hypothetical protein
MGVGVAHFEVQDRKATVIIIIVSEPKNEPGILQIGNRSVDHSTVMFYYCHLENKCSGHHLNYYPSISMK